MAKADSVHSTPRKTASKNNPPVDPTRRHFLTVAVGGTVAVAVPSAALSVAPAIDPVRGLIEAHRNAHAAHLAAIEELARFEEAGDWDHDGITEKPCHSANEAFAALVAAPATTLPGLLAKLAYLQDLESKFETEWMIHECVDASDLIESFTTSFKNGIRRSNFWACSTCRLLEVQHIAPPEV